MGGKLKKLAGPTEVDKRDVRMDPQAKEVLAADLRKLARSNGTSQMLVEGWGLLWMEALTEPGTAKYNWRYRCELLDPVSKVTLMVVRYSHHPTMMDIAVAMFLRMVEVNNIRELANAKADVWDAISS